MANWGSTTGVWGSPAMVSRLSGIREGRKNRAFSSAFLRAPCTANSRDCSQAARKPGGRTADIKMRDKKISRSPIFLSLYFSVSSSGLIAAPPRCGPCGFAPSDFGLLSVFGLRISALNWTWTEVRTFPVRQVLPGTHLVKMDVTLNPIEVRAFGVDRVVVKPQD